MDQEESAENPSKLEETQAELDIEELTDEYERRDRKERGLLLSLLVSIAFVVGPIALLLDILLPAVFSSLPVDMTFVFGSVTGIFVLAAFVKAKMQAS